MNDLRTRISNIDSLSDVFTRKYRGLAFSNDIRATLGEFLELHDPTEAGYMLGVAMRGAGPVKATKRFRVAMRASMRRADARYNYYVKKHRRAIVDEAINLSMDRAKSSGLEN